MGDKYVKEVDGEPHLFEDGLLGPNDLGKLYETLGGDLATQNITRDNYKLTQTSEINLVGPQRYDLHGPQGDTIEPTYDWWDDRDEYVTPKSSPTPSTTVKSNNVTGASDYSNNYSSAGGVSPSTTSSSKDSSIWQDILKGIGYIFLFFLLMPVLSAAYGILLLIVYLFRALLAAITGDMDYLKVTAI